jgi:arylsulfatase A-like enzyme
MIGPGIPRGLRVAAPVALVDILPTVLKLLDLPASEPLSGRSLEELWSARTGAQTTPSAIPRPLYAYLKLPGTRPIGEWYALRQGAWKLVMQGNIFSSLYNLQQDPLEQHNLSQAEPERAGRMRSDLLHWHREMFASGRSLALSISTQMREEQRRQLRALGYGP